MRKKCERKSIQTVTIGAVCDICGRETKQYSFGTGNWAKEYYDIAEVTVSIKTGTIYPECGDTTLAEYDICPDCFRKYIDPVFQSLNIQPVITTSEW